VRIIGIDLPRDSRSEGAESTLVLLDDHGAVSQVRRAATLPEVAAAVAELAAGEPFLIGVDVPVVVPGKQARGRPVENLMRRRFGFRMQPGGRSALTAEPLGIAGEALMAGLAAAGQPCLPYPDRDRRRPGMAEIYPALILKALLWSGSQIAGQRDVTEQQTLFRSYVAPAYRAARLPAKTTWAGQAVAIDLVLRALGRAEGFDLEPVKESLTAAGDDLAVERVAARLDATLIAGMARRYLESSLFVGDRENGYVILPADAFIRRLGSDALPQAGRLFPRASLRERLGDKAKTRSGDLLSVPGRPQKVVASFNESPCFEFDNLDEMLWWKHTRHLSGPALPTEGLDELVVTLNSSDAGDRDAPSLKLRRSRHATLSFRFDPPGAWRNHIATRDGRTYTFRVLTAVYETLPSEE
jgi:predicted RNase H-like nuclease